MPTAYLAADGFEPQLREELRRSGVAVAAEWKLPEAITEAIRDCSDYDGADRTSVANIVRLANALAKREGYTTGPIDAADIEAMIMVGMSMLGGDTSVVDRPSTTSRRDSA
jgi:HD-like signal output (HDOD) protein